MKRSHRRGGTVWVLAASPDWDADIAWLPQPDRVVAADGGAAIAARLGLLPDLIVGDFDSCDLEALTQIEEWRAAGAEVRTYQHETKVETDTELALLAALELAPSRVYLLGATGGRLDHTLANILLLTHPALDEIEVRIVEGRQEIYLAKPGSWYAINGSVGDTVSLLPVGNEVTGVSLRGMLYPLSGETLLHGRGRGVSNEVASVDAAVRFAQGLLLVVVSHI